MTLRAAVPLEPLFSAGGGRVPTARCLALMLATSVAACGGERPAAPAPPRPVETMVVKPAAGGGQSMYPGQIVSRYEARLGFRVAGQLVSKLVNVGDRVHAGQVLARLDAADAELGLGSAQAQASAAGAAARQQATELARARRLLDEGFISQAEFDRERVAVEQARAQLRSSQAQSSAAARQIGFAVLRAERGGVVTEVSGEVGEIVPAGQAVVVVANPDEREAAISVPEGEVAAFRSSALSVRIWSTPEVSYPGRIRTLSPAANPQTRTFDARIAFTAPAGAAAIGSTAEVVARKANTSAALSVPVSAVSAVKGQSVVWVASGSPARVAPRAVRLVQVQQDSVLIAGGVRPGERVVTAGVHLLQPGDVVRPVPSTAAAPQ